jgi:hypothetical protein
MSERVLKTLQKFEDFQAEYEGSIPFTRAQNGASAQYARPHHEQGQDAFQKLLVAGDVI